MLMNQLPLLTTKVEAMDSEGTSEGTGFFFEFYPKPEVPVITVVTARHVVEGAEKARIRISKLGAGAGTRGYNSFRVDNLSEVVLFHPDPAVDLAVFPVGDAVRMIENAGKIPKIRTLSPSFIPTEEEIASLSLVEDVFMIGYPEGVWDEWNNFPVVRRGITATPYIADYNGEPKFLVDLASFRGSSGSPILIADDGSRGVRQGLDRVDDRFHFIGIQTSAYFLPAEEGSETAMPPQPLHLGVAIKSKVLLDFTHLIADRLSLTDNH